MKLDPGSLQNLRDIVEPVRVSWWPPAPGWWGLLIITLGFVVWGMIRSVRRWRANAYRRAALRELERATTAVEVAELLKRTALCVWSRGEVASLSGAAWCEWLSTTGDQPASEVVQQTLIHDVFSGETGSSAVTELSRFADRWIRTHRGPQGDIEC